MTDANGNTVELEYDHLNRQTRIVYDDGSAVWDALGRLVARVDQNGRRTDLEYDCSGRLIRVEDALNQVPPGFTDAALRPIRYTFASPLRFLGNPIRGDRWKKITVNCYTWTAYAAGVAVVISVIPL